MSEMQGAFQKGFSSTDVVALLNETVAYHVEQGNAVHVVLLDVAKAFDSVWSDGLLYKLFNMGLEGRLWRLLRKSYTGFTCEVFVNKTKSSPFLLERGVHQGAPLSMRLYQTFNNDLLDLLGQSRASVGIAELNTGTPAFADDVAMVALFKLCMNILLRIAFGHSRTWRYDFNARKSLAICFGKDEAVNQRLHLGDEEIPVSAATCHMGVPLCPTKPQLKNELVKRCEKVKRETRVMMSMGSALQPVPPSVGSKMYRSVCLPKLVYGLEACSMDTACINELEKANRCCAKAIQGLPPQTPNPVATATRGWLSVEGMIHLAKMVLLYRWLSMPGMNIFKRTAIMRLTQCIYSNGNQATGSPLCESFYYSFYLYIKYGMEHHIKNVLDRGMKLPLTTLKRVLREAVQTEDWVRWEASRRMYPSLSVFRLCFEEIELCVWWRVSYCLPHLTKATVTIVRLMCGQHCLASNHGTGGSSLCAHCESYEVESVSHLLFTCNAWAPVRGHLLETVLSSMPVAMSNDVVAMNAADRTSFILSGFHARYTPEWLDLYQATATFVNQMYRERCRAVEV
jgi:hypothetical protein